jgi:hypothetical protein
MVKKYEQYDKQTRARLLREDRRHELKKLSIVGGYASIKEYQAFNKVNKPRSEAQQYGDEKRREAYEEYMVRNKYNPSANYKSFLKEGLPKISYYDTHPNAVRKTKPKVDFKVSRDKLTLRSQAIKIVSEQYKLSNRKDWHAFVREYLPQTIDEIYKENGYEPIDRSNRKPKKSRPRRIEPYTEERPSVLKVAKERKVTRTKPYKVIVGEHLNQPKPKPKVQKKKKVVPLKKLEVDLDFEFEQDIMKKEKGVKYY